MAIDTEEAEDEMKSLTQTLSPETAQHVLQLEVAMKNASEDERNAVLMFSSKPKGVSVSEEKSSVEPEGSATLGITNADGHNGHGSREQLLKVSDNDEAGNCEENNADKDLSVDTTGKEDRKIGYDADETPLDQACATGDASVNPFDSVDKNVVTPNEDQKLQELSNKAEEVEDDLSTTNENSADSLQESGSSSEDEKMPELLSKKAGDVSSGVEFIDDEGPVELGLSDKVEINGTSFVEKTPYLQHAPLSNCLPQSLETEIIEKNDPKIDEGESSSSSDDDQVESSSSHSVVTSSESDLSEAAVQNDSFQGIQSDGKNDDVRNREEAPGTFSITGSKDDGIAVIEGGVLHLEAKNEPGTVVTVPVLERTFSTSSTSTQTSCENLHLAKDLSFNTFGNFEYGNLDSILSGDEKGSSKLPFYYQPQIVMHGEKPILVLQPVPSMATSSDNIDSVAGVENSAVKASVPIILPLASPVIDKATKDAIFQQINGTAASPFEGEEECYTKNSSSKSFSSGFSSPVTAPGSQQNGTDGDTQLNITGHDKPVYESIPVVDKCVKTSESEETENLPEWVPPSELDKAFSAAAKETLVSTKEKNPVTLTFPIVSLPSTNPFAKDLAAQEYGCSDVKEDSLLNFGPEQTQQYSLFGPPSSPSLSQGARPKTYQDPGHVGSATNPFAPDLTPKKQGRRREQKPADATEVVISAEVHPSFGEPTEIHCAQPKRHRHRMSSESMVTLIETSNADTTLTSFDSLGVDQSQEIEMPQPQPRPQQESKETSQATGKPKLRVVSAI